MAARNIVHETHGLRGVFREKLGSDVLDAPTIHMLIATHIAKQIRIDEPTKIPNRYWGRIVFVTNVMQQVIRLEGDDRFDIPSIDAPEDVITDFYEFMMERPEAIVDFFRDGFKRLEPVPLAIGATSES